VNKYIKNQISFNCT